MACAGYAAGPQRQQQPVWPLHFEPNGNGGYAAQGLGYRVSVSAAGASIGPVRVLLQGRGNNLAARGEALSPQLGVSSYLIGADAAGWRTNVPHFGRVRYAGVYPGIDLVYYGQGRELEYDFVVQPGADASRVGLSFAGAETVSLEHSGDILLRSGGVSVRQKRPVAYQDIDGRRVMVAAKFQLRGREARVVLGRYDRSQPLVIDPVVTYSSYFGGSANDVPHGLATDSSGAVYMVGYTGSTDLPTTTGALQSANGGTPDAFIAKFAAGTGALVYCTYLGGSGYDSASGVALDSAGNVYVTGETTSTNFPVTAGALQGAYAGGYDVFLTKLSSAGQLLYSTYLGGPADDVANGVAVDPGGAVYLAGYTSSTNFPTTSGAIRSGVAGPSDAFALKLSASFSIVYSTLLGGSGTERANGIAVDHTGAASIVGMTDSTDFPVLGAMQSTRLGAQAGFLTRLSPTGALVFSTYLAGGTRDQANGVAVDSVGSSIVTGITDGNNVGAYAALQSQNRGGSDAFIMKLSPGGLLMLSTYYGGTGDDSGASVAVDAVGDIYMVGETNSTDLVLTAPSQAQAKGGGDAMVLELNPLSGQPIFATYLGGSARDSGTALVLDPSANVYVAGVTSSTDFPVTAQPQQAVTHGNFEGFLTSFSALVGANGCLYSVTPSSVTVPATAGTGSFAISANYACLFGFISSQSPFVIVDPSSIIGASATIQYKYAANPSATPRTGTVAFGSSTVFTITQAGYSPTAPSLTVSSAVDLFSAGSNFALNSAELGTTLTRTLQLDYTNNGAAASVPFSTSVSSTAPLLVSVSPSSGTTPATLVLTVQTTGLAAGRYSSTITISAAGQTVAYPVTVQVNSGRVAEAAVYRASTGLVLADLNGDGVCCQGDLIGTIGQAGDVPLAGYWSAGAGPIRFGLYRPSTGLFLLDVNGNGQFDAGTDNALTLVPVAGDVPVIGDWTGTGVDRVGVFRASTGTWYLDVNGDGSFTGRAYLGQSGDIPLVGHWSGSGTTSQVGIYRPVSVNGQPGNFFLVDSNGDGLYTSADQAPFFLGQPGDVPIVGAWSGNGITKVGVYRPSTGLFIEDSNGNYAYDGPLQDSVFFFGPYLAGTGTTTSVQMGDLPVVGDWANSYVPTSAFLSTVPSGRQRLGIYRPSTGTFFFDVFGDGSFQGRAYFGGQSSDWPLGSPIVVNGSVAGVVRMGSF